MLQDVDLSYVNGRLYTGRDLEVVGLLLADNSVGIGTSAPQEALDLDSTTGVQRRLRTVSYQETDSIGSAETVRLHFGNAAGKTGSSAKNAIAFFADNISTTQSQVWLQAHDYLHWYNAITLASVDTALNRVTLSAVSDLPSSPGWRVQFSTTGTLPAPLAAATNYYAKRISSTVFEIYSNSTLATIVDLTDAGTGTHTMTPDNEFNNNHHRHFSIEVSNTDLQNKNTRFSIPWGYDWTQIGFFQGDVNVNGGKFRVLGPSGSFRQIVLGNTLSDNLVPDGTEGRFSLQLNNAAESGAGVGSDFRLVRYNDAGVALDAPIYVKRSNGRIAFGIAGNVAPQASVDITNDGTLSGLYIANTATGTANTAVIRLETSDTTKRAVDFRVTGDGVSRIRWDTSASGSGTLTFGDGTTADTNLYRSAADTLKTDDTLVVGSGTLKLGSAADADLSRSGAGALSTTGSLAVGTTLTAAGIPVTGDLNAPRPADSGLKAWTFDPATANVAFTILSGTLYLTAIFIRATTSVTKIWWGMGNAASAPTAGQNFVGIFNSSGTLLASAGIDTQVTGSSGPNSATISSTSLTPGLYWVGALQNATTPQQMVRSQPAVLSIANMGLGTSVLRAAVNGTSLTAMPSSITPASNSQSGAAHLLFGLS